MSLAIFYDSENSSLSRIPKVSHKFYLSPLLPFVSSSSHCLSVVHFLIETSRKSHTMLSISVADVPLPYIILAGVVFYVVGLGIYRLYVSPLASIPGPKLAALTQWYETYYEMCTTPTGQFMFHYRELHKKYGMHSPNLCL